MNTSTTQGFTIVPSEIISIIGNQPRTTSLKVAEVFGKLHKNIIQRIESLDCSAEFASANFSAQARSVKIDNGAARETKYYEMTKDGFMFLVMGFTGEKAAKMKEAYIAAFNWMAAELQRQYHGEQSSSALPGVAMLNDVPVLTMQRLAACFGMSIDPIRRNCKLFPERFVHGVHWFKLEGDALRRFGLANLHTGEVSRNFGRSMIVWTEAGAQMHAACFAPAQGKAGLAAVAAYLRGEALSATGKSVPAAEPLPASSAPWPVSPADLAGGKRVLLSLNHKGALRVNPVPSGAFLLTSAELAQQIAAPDSLWSRDELRAVGSAVMARLARWG